MSKHSKKISISFRTIIIVVLTIIFLYGIFLLIKINIAKYIEIKKQKDTSKLIDSIEIDNYETQSNAMLNQEDIISERILKIKELKKENEEIVGWLEIEGTNISYPVLQGMDNDYYLNHNYKKEYISSGSIFLDKDYDFDIPSSNILIYGHRNKDGLMFDELVKYKDEKFYKEHKTIRFTTDSEDAEYEIIGAFKSRVYYKDEKNVFRYYYFVNAKDETEYQEYVNNVKKASLYETDITATYSEQLITLSTCDYEVENGRFAVVAKKIKIY